MAKVTISRSRKSMASKYRTKRFRLGKRAAYRSIGMRIPNKFAFKRQGYEAQLINTTIGAVALQAGGGLTGWSVGTPVADANGLFQFGGAMQFQLNQAQEWKDFTNLFDRYKISGCKVKFIPVVNMATPGGAVPVISYAIDLDDASIPATYAEINQKYNVHKKRLDKPCSIYVKPRIAQAIYSGLTSGYAIGNKNTYIDCNDPGVPMYGLKFWIRDCFLGASSGVSPLEANTVIRIETTFYLSMKDSQ